MKSRGYIGFVRGPIVPLVLFVCLIGFSLATRVPPTAAAHGASAQNQSTSTTTDGLQTVTLDTPAARVTVKLPDDIRTGDKVSGTLAVEPKGSTAEEKESNRATLRSRVLRLMISRVRKPGEPPVTNPPAVTVPLSGGDTSTVQTMRGPGNNVRIEFLVPAPGDFALKPEADPAAEVGNATVPVDANVGVPDRAPANKFTVPSLGQTGRPVVITGPFDGKASNTEVKATPPTVFKKTSTLEDGIDLPVIAESPRRAVIQFPQEITGPVQITVNDGSNRTPAPFRNVGVSLSAPKTNLVKGERTTLTVQVTGLQGLSEPVPLTLRNSGVIAMTGGAYQQFSIEPSQVSADGVYTLTRDIIGVQAGGWGATATVVTRPFNVVLQDESIPSLVVVWNTVTGQYFFPPPQPKMPLLGGTGQIAMKGCIITLTHNAPDRRVFAKLDACTNAGEASVETTTPKAKFNITDRNTADNTVPFP